MDARHRPPKLSNEGALLLRSIQGGALLLRSPLTSHTPIGLLLLLRAPLHKNKYNAIQSASKKTRCEIMVGKEKAVSGRIRESDLIFVVCHTRGAARKWASSPLLSSPLLSALHSLTAHRTVQKNRFLLNAFSSSCVFFIISRASFARAASISFSFCRSRNCCSISAHTIHAITQSVRINVTHASHSTHTRHSHIHAHHEITKITQFHITSHRMQCTPHTTHSACTHQSVHK